VEAINAAVHVVRLLSLLKAVKKSVQLLLMSEGMRGFAVELGVGAGVPEDDCARTAVVNKEIIAKDFIMVS